uniref:BZIP domain-containing protein n=1 Tax=Odontella aurita TaxID=265563 RepID=A0A7S4MTJ2_9STRA|mmetsp:Transcript_31588/g.94511  ORF Transcript_31588/g.94511 Transcript_31588/m.94511 type:complete len:419 (+) Transcript_31588:253-1509(+)|eukprot:CAMPEP_0113551456 /NCGR_PEP_ID=MMETSP0015_2-20120614/14535_1 /TAXON_ID=2838 /ORGANISM="Odontella" /LENGTH=418 /DNA_ID=CAMNT_0000452351 /DNA_START=204 /DNA_END=1460 /DNA_ORIENTATION=+ /assembly_acc=CAM_ASM_000160
MSSAELKQALAEAAIVGGGSDSNGVGDEPEKNLPMRKRKKGQAGSSGDNSPATEDSDSAPRKRGRPKGSLKVEDLDADVYDGNAGSDDLKPLNRGPMSKAREIRLEQNRKAARESRRRKKVMIEELQRSVIFFSRANGTLKQQNDELQRLLVQAQSQVQAIEQNGATVSAQPKEGESGTTPAEGQAPAPGADAAPAPAAPAPAPSTEGGDPAVAQQAVAAAQAAQQAQAQAAAAQFQFQNMAQAQAAQAAATQAIYESQGFPPAAARAAAQTLVGGQGGAAPGQAPAPADGSATAPAPGIDSQTAQAPQAAAAMAANPFMAAMMGMGAVPPAGAPGVAPALGAPAPTAGAPGATPNPMDAINQFAMQQQFAAQLGAMGAAGVPGAVPPTANPALFQQMQLAAQWPGAPVPAPAAPAPH